MTEVRVEGFMRQKLGRQKLVFRALGIYATEVRVTELRVEGFMRQKLG